MKDFLKFLVSNLNENKQISEIEGLLNNLSVFNPFLIYSRPDNFRKIIIGEMMVLSSKKSAQKPFLCVWLSKKA